MLHLVLYVLLAIVVAVGLFLAASRFLPAGEQIAPAVRDEPVWELPAERSLGPEDIDTVRLPVALRGYRFAETDTLLDRLAGELRSRDAEIARLRSESAPGKGGLAPRRPAPALTADADRALDPSAGTGLPGKHSRADEVAQADQVARTDKVAQADPDVETDVDPAAVTDERFAPPRPE